MCGGQGEVPQRQPDHRWECAGESPEAVHDLAAGVEESEVDGPGDPDNKGGLGVGDADTQRPQRKDDGAAGAHGCDERGARP